jgi:hypothetical protein
MLRYIDSKKMGRGKHGNCIFGGGYKEKLTLRDNQAVILLCVKYAR